MAFSALRLMIASLACVSGFHMPVPAGASREGAATRRGVLQSGFAAAISAGLPLRADAQLDQVFTVKELPSNMRIALDQNGPLLQLAGDFYAFILYDQVMEPNTWDNIGNLMSGSSIGSAQSPSKLEREIVNPMRIVSLAFPPDAGGDEMAAALGKFQKAMFYLNKKAGRAPGPTQRPSAQEIGVALGYWEEGRVALNEFFATLNEATSTKRLTSIPKDVKAYPRSKKLYTQLQKDAKLCQNRGGQVLADVWGNLMVYGTVPGQEPCGQINMANYFEQAADRPRDKKM